MSRVRVLYNNESMWASPEKDMLVLDNGVRIPEPQAEYLAPVAPTKIIAIHLNFPSRLNAMGASLPAWPSYFLKPPSSVCGHRTVVTRPKGTKYLNYEGEIALVIGKKADRVRREDAWEYIGGYSAANDFGLHDFRTSDRGSMLRVKGQNGFCPIGPRLIGADEVDSGNIRLITYVNGKQVQEGKSDELIFPFDYLIADLSRLVTLEPGDVILTGSPANSRPVQPGDTVTVELDGLCRLENTIAETEVDFGDFGAQPEDSEDARKIAYEVNQKK